MKRRTLLAAAATPLVFRARAATATIGWITVESATAVADFLAAFKAGLASEFARSAESPQVLDRYAENSPAGVAAVVKQLQGQGVSLIVTHGLAGPLAIQAKPAVPIVFAYSGDPVQAGMVESLARPGGNATGMTFLSIELSPKRIGFAREIVPGCRKVVLLSNLLHFGEDREIAACQEAVKALGIDMSVRRVQTRDEAVVAAGDALEKGAQAVVTLPSGAMLQHVPALVTACSERRVPLIGGWASFARRGAVLSYGPDLQVCFGRVAWYAARVLGGAAPSTLPIEQPSSFELVINKKAADGLGLTLPVTLLAQANEVIE